MSKTIWPKMITDLPEAEVPFPDTNIWILQGENNEVAFTDNRVTGEAPTHSHGEQWGIVVEGEMELTINGVTKTYRKGDTYLIPEGAPHSAKYQKHLYTIDFFADRDRYKPKEK